MEHLRSLKTKVYPNDISVYLIDTYSLNLRSLWKKDIFLLVFEAVTKVSKGMKKKSYFQRAI